MTVNEPMAASRKETLPVPAATKWLEEGEQAEELEEVDEGADTLVCWCLPVLCELPDTYRALLLLAAALRCLVLV